jgi:hypothetical protein
LSINESEIPWVFIPLSNEHVTFISAWMHRLANSKSDDKQISEKCESIIKEAFQNNDLIYQTEIYGGIKMPEVRLLLGSDGICVPEQCFLNPPKNLVRIEEPLRPFVKEA